MLIPDLRGWWVSDDPGNDISSGYLATVRDRSGNGNPLQRKNGASTSEAALITGALNGRTVWRTATSGSQLGRFTNTNTSIVSIVNAASGVTMFAVQRVTPAQTVTGDMSVIRLNTSGNNQSRAMIGRGDATLNGAYAGGRRLTANAYAGISSGVNHSTDWLVLVAVIDYANARVDLTVNGTVYSNTSFQTPGTSSAANAGTLVVGDEGTSNAAVGAGDYAELGVSRGAVTLARRQELEGYLAHSWGLQANLPSGHPYKASPP